MKESHKKIGGYLIIIFMINFLIMIYGCCSTSKEISSYESAEMLAVKKFGSGYEILKNESGTFILCSKIDERKNHPHKSLEYFVYDLTRKEIIYEEKLLDAEIKWLDNYNIEIKLNPEIISDDASIIFILNILTLDIQKINLNKSPYAGSASILSLGLKSILFFLFSNPRLKSGVNALTACYGFSHDLRNIS